MFLIEKIKKIFLPFYRLSETKKILNILNSNSKKRAMFVGGCVRKYLTNEKIDDIDIATTLTPSEVISFFQNTEIQVKKTGIEHGTLTLILNNQKFEITTLRKDISTDGRHANIKFSDNWEEDSNRRDFTINAIYLDQKGKVFDPHLGVNDLKNKKVKFIGDPNNRIKEDYLRILRFLRFSIEYKSFEINKQTQQAIKLNLDGITRLSKERVFSELEKIIKLKNFDDILKSKFLLSIFNLIFPEIKYLDRIKRLKNLSTKHKVQIKKNIIFSILLLDSSNNHEYFFHKYNVSNTIKNEINLFFKVLKDIKLNKEFFLKNLKKNIFKYGKDNLKNLLLIESSISKKNNNSSIKSIFEEIHNTNIPKFPLTGNDLINKGVKEGKKVGEILDRIEKKWIENDFKIKEEEIKILIQQN
tara:strand:+ start:1713 stop:2954 length:1242 start_codon:yes stop_codon:yes gene_type:complete